MRERAADGVTGFCRRPEFVADGDVGVTAGTTSASGAKVGDIGGESVVSLGLGEGLGAAVGEELGAVAPAPEGPGAAAGGLEALHWNGTAAMLQARGRDMVAFGLIGI